MSFQGRFKSAGEMWKSDMDWIAPSLSETINLSKDDGFDKKKNGKSLLAWGPRPRGPYGVWASRLLWDAGGSDRRHSTLDLLYSPDLKWMGQAGIEPSVGSVGVSYDNALAETINGLYKTELVHRQGQWCNMQDLEMATLGWVDWFNNSRLLGPNGNTRWRPTTPGASKHRRGKTPKAHHS
jgi:putative transposase